MANNKVYNLTVNGANASQAVNALTQQLNRLEAQYKATNKGSAEAETLLKRIAATKGDLAALTTQIEQVGKANVNLGVSLESASESGVKSVQALRLEAALLTKELANLPPGSAEAQAALESLADVKANIGDLNTEIKLLDPGARLEGVVKLTQTVAGGFSSITAAVQLFGGTGDDVEKVQAKMQELLVLMQGLEVVRSGFEKQNLAGIKSMLSLGDSFSLAGIKAKLFGTTTRAAISATGIGLLVVALGTIIANFDSISDAGQRLYQRLKGVFGGVGEFVDGAIAKTRDFLSVVTFGLIDNAKTAAIKAQQEVLKATSEVNVGLRKQQAEAYKVLFGEGEAYAKQRLEGLKKDADDALDIMNGTLKLLSKAQVDALYSGKDLPADMAKDPLVKRFLAERDAATAALQATKDAQQNLFQVQEDITNQLLTEQERRNKAALTITKAGAVQIAQQEAADAAQRVKQARLLADELDTLSYGTPDTEKARTRRELALKEAQAAEVTALRNLSDARAQAAQDDLSRDEATAKAKVTARTRDNKELLAVELDFARQRRDLLIDQAREKGLGEEQKKARLAAAQEAAVAVIELDRSLGDARRSMEERLDDLRLATMKEGLAKQLAELENSADKAKAAVTGSEKEKQEQIVLIDQATEAKRLQIIREAAVNEVAIRRQLLEDVEALRAGRTDTLNDDLSAVNARLQRDREAELAAAEKTGADKYLINAKYDLLTQQAAEDSVNNQVARFKQRYEEVASLIQGVISTITSSLAAGLDEQIADIDLRSQVLTDRLADLDTQLGNRRSEIESIEQALATATGTRRAQLIAKLDQERNAERALAAQRAQGADQLKKQETEKLKLEREKQALERQGQAITAVSTALEAVLALVKYNTAAADAGLKDPNPYTKAITIATVIAASIAGFASLKNALKFADGGYVSDGNGGMIRGAGGPTEDLIPAKLSNGEFVIRAAVVEQPGMRQFLEHVNAAGGVVARPAPRGGFANGGLVTPASGGQDDVVGELRRLQSLTVANTEATTKAIAAINTQVVIGEYQAVQIAELQQKVAAREAAASV